MPKASPNAFRASEAAAGHRNLVKPVLNYLQTAVSLSYLPAGEADSDRPASHVCILHDLLQLEPYIPKPPSRLSSPASPLRATVTYCRVICDT